MTVPKLLNSFSCQVPFSAVLSSSNRWPPDCPHHHPFSSFLLWQQLLVCHFGPPFSSFWPYFLSQCLAHPHPHLHPHPQPHPHHCRPPYSSCTLPPSHHHYLHCCHCYFDCYHCYFDCCHCFHHCHCCFHHSHLHSLLCHFPSMYCAYPGLGTQYGLSRHSSF